MKLSIMMSRAPTLPLILFSLLITPIYCPGFEPSKNFSLKRNMYHPFQESFKKSKEEYLKTLETTSLLATWDFFLENQANLYFPQECVFLRQHIQNHETVLDLGTGNGHYLHKLAMSAPDIHFLGIDSNQKYIDKASQAYTGSNISFGVGDAEVEDPNLFNQFDAVIFRLVLQHTKNPKLAMEQASKYLKKEGILIIIDSCDTLKESTFSQIPCVNKAKDQHNRLNQEKQLGNREISIEILKEIKTKSSHLSDLYTLVFSNIDVEGNKVKDVVKFHTNDEADRLFHQCMLYLSILNKQWHIPVDFETAYEEVWHYTQNPEFSSVPGIHYLVLKRI